MRLRFLIKSIVALALIMYSASPATAADKSFSSSQKSSITALFKALASSNTDKIAVAQKLDLANDKAEAIVEQCINWLVVTSSVVLQVVKVIKK